MRRLYDSLPQRAAPFSPSQPPRLGRRLAMSLPLECRHGRDAAASLQVAAHLRPRHGRWAIDLPPAVDDALLTMPLIIFASAAHTPRAGAGAPGRCFCAPADMPPSRQLADFQLDEPFPHFRRRFDYGARWAPLTYLSAAGDGAAGASRLARNTQHDDTGRCTS